MLLMPATRSDRRQKILKSLIHLEKLQLKHYFRPWFIQKSLLLLLLPVSQLVAALPLWAPDSASQHVELPSTS